MYVMEKLTRDSFWGPAGATGTGVRMRRGGMGEGGDGCKGNVQYIAVCTSLCSIVL